MAEPTMDTESHFSTELLDSEPMRRATMAVAQALMEQGRLPTSESADEARAMWDRCRNVAQYAVSGFVLGGGFEPDAMEAVRAAFKSTHPTN